MDEVCPKYTILIICFRPPLDAASGTQEAGAILANL